MSLLGDHIHPIIVQKSYYAKTRRTRHLENGTSDHNFKLPKTLFNTNYPPKTRKNHLRNHFRLLQSGLSAIATYKMRIFSKSFHLPISALLWDGCGHRGESKTINSTVSLFRLAWGPFSANVYTDPANCNVLATCSV